MKIPPLIGLIPAAGLGSRLAPLPIPKELYPIGFQAYRVDGRTEQRPKVIGQYVLEAMRHAGCREVGFILGKRKDLVMEYFGSGRQFGVRTFYLFNDAIETGLPAGLDLATPLVGGATVLFGMPDTIFEPQDAFTRLLARHSTWKADLTLGVFPVRNPEKLCPVVFSRETGVVRRVVDKPKRAPAKNSWGILVWGPRFTKLLHRFVTAQSPRRTHVLADVINLAIRRKLRVFAYEFNGGHYVDIGHIHGLQEAIRRVHG